MISKKDKNYESVLKILKRTSIDRPLTSEYILHLINCRRLYSNYLADSVFRKIIHNIRISGELPVISCAKGYYVSYDKKQIKMIVKSLEDRAHEILEAAKALKSHWL